MSDLDARLRERIANGSVQSTLETIPSSREHEPHGTIPNTPLVASAISFALGGISIAGALAFISGGMECPWCWVTPQLGFVIMAIAAFHEGEFLVTAGWNRPKCSVDSFLLNNGVEYHVAHLLGISEYLIVLYFWPSSKSIPYVSMIGMIVTLFGQIIRSTAMVHATTNFSHSVQFKKAVDHQLVTSGIYSMFRHPSYAGFFYWALGTQLVLQNPLTFIVHFSLLWRFFSKRIRGEEFALVAFFKEDYIRYRQRVGTKIPFIP